MGKRILILIVAVLTISLTGCNNEKGKNLYVGVSGFKKDFVSVGELNRKDELTVIDNLYEGLFEVNGENQVVPGLADSFSYSDDGKIMYIKIKEGIKWSDGSLLTAEDVKKGLNNALAGKGRYSYQYMYFDDEAAEKIRINEEGILELYLKKPFVDFEKILAQPFFYPVLNQEDPLAGPFTGPFVVEKNSAEELVLKANPLFADQNPVLTESISFEFGVPDEELLRRYQDKEYDIIFPEDTLAGIETDYFTGPSVRLIWFNGISGELQEESARKKIADSIDKKEIIKVLENKEKVVEGIYPSVYRDKEDFPDSNYVSDYDFLNQDFRFLILEGEEENLIALEVKEQLYKELGLNIEIISKEPEAYLSALKNADFDLALETWEGEYHGKNAYFELFVSPLNTPLNISGLIDPEITSLQNKVAATSDPELRESLFRDLEGRILFLCPAVFLSEGSEKPVYIQRVKSVQVDSIYEYHDYSLVEY